MITKDFIRQVLAAEKELLKMSELRQVNVPKYDELSVKNIFPNLKDNPTFMVHIPDRLP